MSKESPGAMYVQRITLAGPNNPGLVIENFIVVAHAGKYPIHPCCAAHNVSVLKTPDDVRSVKTALFWFTKYAANIIDFWLTRSCVHGLIMAHWGMDVHST